MAADPWVGTWRPHRPRGPIAALYCSPGPKYGLPSNVGHQKHDPSRSRAPAYSFGLRVGDSAQHRSPGPIYLLPPGTTVKGSAGTPAWSLRGRPHDLLASLTPGPGCYSPERANHLAFPSAPACSLRSRFRIGPFSQTPGPAAYLLPPVLGPRVVDRSSAPSYSMPGRSDVGAFWQDLSKTPGPCRYQLVQTEVYKRQAPRHSMLGRKPLPISGRGYPGPGTYNLRKDEQRGVTFGIRHSQYLAPLIVNVPD